MPAWCSYVTKPATQLNDKMSGAFHGGNSLFGPHLLATVADSKFPPADQTFGHHLRLEAQWE